MRPTTYPHPHILDVFPRVKKHNSVDVSANSQPIPRNERTRRCGVGVCFVSMNIQTVRQMGKQTENQLNRQQTQSHKQADRKQTENQKQTNRQIEKQSYKQQEY